MGGMLVYNFLNLGRLFCTYFLVTDLGKENLLMLSLHLTHCYFRGLSAHTRNGEERQRSGWLAVTEAGEPGLLWGRPQAYTEDVCPRPREERLGFVLHNL